MPRPLLYALCILTALSLVPVAYLTKARVSDDGGPRVQVVPDMDNQPRYNAQAASEFFADGRAMRPPVTGTVARGGLADLPLVGAAGEEGRLSTMPGEITAASMERGRERFDVFCSPCHGSAGRGDGPVHRRATRRGESGWTPPTDVTGDVIAERTDGELYRTITDGIRNMPAYGPQIPVEDRWAIVAYVRALQRSVRGTLDDVPDSLRSTIE